MNEIVSKVLGSIATSPQRTDSLPEQLTELTALALKLGMHEAARLLADLLILGNKIGDIIDGGDWLRVGAHCHYHPNSAGDDRATTMDAEVIGFSPSGKVRIKARDRATDEWTRATVNRRRLSPTGIVTP